MKGFVNANIYVENMGIIKTSLGFEDGIIKYIGDDSSKITCPIEIKDDQVVVSGFIDEHIHGAGGSDAMDGTESALKTIANCLAKEGTTSFLATTMTQSKENIISALNAIKDYKEKNFDEGSELLGVHLEGPFISTKHIGAQPLEYVLNPDIEVFDEFYKASGNSIKIVSLAPENQGAEELIAHLNKLGVVASAGHTDAGYNQIKNAIDCGLKSVTHAYNAQKPLHHREIGTVGSCLLFDQLNAETICDLVHLSIPAIKLLIKNKPHDKFTLITDSMRAKNLCDGVSELGGQKVIVKNGEARLENGALAGSILKMNDATKNLVLHCGVKFTDAIDFATINPAKNLGLDKEMGSIKVGKKANFCILDGEFNVKMTIRCGKQIFKD